jgi:hypothetical protein
MRNLSLLILPTLILAGCKDQGEEKFPGCIETSNSGIYACQGNPTPVADECCQINIGSYPALYHCWDSSTADSALCDETPFDPAGGSGSGASGSGGATSGGDGCVADCPEDFGGTCPGAAEWGRGVVVWGIWYSPALDEYRVADGSYGNFDDPKCTEALDVCIAYQSPDDVAALTPNLLQAQAEACDALTTSQLAGLGIADNASPEWNLVGHRCTFGQSDLSITYQGQALTASLPTQIEDCAAGPYEYEGFCSASSCPNDYDGTTTAADSGSTSEGAGYDCSAFVSSNVSWTKDNPSGTLRSATVRGGLFDALAGPNPYDALYYCAEAWIDSGTRRLYEVESTSILTHLGLLQDDKVESVDGESGSVNEMMSLIASDIQTGNDSTIVIERGTREIMTITYTVEWVD